VTDGTESRSWIDDRFAMSPRTHPPRAVIARPVTRS
jgi:hypothetical protein